MAGQRRKTATKPAKTLEQNFLRRVVDIGHLKSNSIDMARVARSCAKELTCRWC